MAAVGKKISVRLEPTQTGTRISVEAQRHRVELETDERGRDSMGVLVPWNDRLFQYTRKNNGVPVWGRVVVDGQLTTPPLASGCLAGITRQLVIELVEVIERPLPLDALDQAAEVYVTSSTRDVMPAHRVDGRALPTCPGPSTTAAADALAALLADDLDP